MEVLKLISGDPNGNGRLIDYTFEKTTVEGEDELRLQAQLKQWSLVDSFTIDKQTGDGDSYGCGSSGTYETCLLKLSKGCFIHDSALLGYKSGNMILFLNGKSLGRTTYRSYDDGCEETGEYSLKRNTAG